MPKLNAIQFWVWSFLNFESQSIEYFFGLTETQIDLPLNWYTLAPMKVSHFKF